MTEKNADTKRSAKLTVITNKGGKPYKQTVKTARRSNGLTDKQEAFAQAVFDGSNFSEAYRLAYDAQNMSAASIHQEAYQLVTSPKVALRLEELESVRVKQQSMQALSRSEKVIKKLEDIGLGDDQGGTAQIRALELLGKSIGLFKDVVETEDKTERNADTIKAELEQKLQRMLGG